MEQKKSRWGREDAVINAKEQKGESGCTEEKFNDLRARELVLCFRNRLPRGRWSRATEDRE